MTISEFSRDAVCRYLRSVVFIDDKLFSTPHLSVENETLAIDGPPELVINGGTASSDNDSGPEISGGDAQDGGVVQLDNKSQEDAHAITDGFAKEGIICGVYKPMFFPETGFEGEESFTTLLNVCKNADVFILDWQLFKENDKAVAQLLSYILTEDKSSSAPNPVRFCAIYTDNIVNTICDKIFEALRRIVPETKRQGLKLSAGGMTVCIYARGENSPSPIAAKDLAGKIISDFAKTYEGIMPALALKGIASIRNNVKRILDKFPADMDPALVLHAGLTIRGKCISQDVATLVSDEVAALLEDEKEKDETIYDLCGGYVDKCGDAVFDKTGDEDLDKAISSRSTSVEIKQYIQNIFKQQTFFPKNEDGVFKPVFRDCKESDKCSPNARLVQLLGRFVARKADPAGMYKFGALAALFCHRTNYATSKMLRFGTVVKEMFLDGHDGGYFLCLMPLCDSIRLTDKDKNGNVINHKFPFWQLSELPKNFQGRNHGLVLKGADGEFHPYCAKGKIRESFSLFEFNSENSIVSFDSGIVKTAGGTHTFQWVAELKSAHIQRMAEFVSREFSRVGLTESEWLRLQVDR